MGDIAVPICDGCRQPMRAVAEVPRLGRQLGARFFECAACFRSKAADLPPTMCEEPYESKQAV